MAFKNDTDAELIAKSASVANVYTSELHAYLMSLFPTPESVQENHNAYTASYTAMLGGDAEKAKECEAFRTAVNENLSILLGLAKAVTVKDPKAPEKLCISFPRSKASYYGAQMAKPLGFKVVYTPEGMLVGSVTKVEAARGYQIWGCDSDPNVESNWRLVASSSSCKGIAITGLDRAKNIWLKIRAVRGKGVAGPWSNYINLPPN